MSRLAWGVLVLLLWPGSVLDPIGPIGPIGAAAAVVDPAVGLSMQRVTEPREGAFSLLLPAGWSMRGGIYRVDPAQAGGPLNSMEAKCQLTCAADPAETVRFQILPDIVYAHAGIGGGFFQRYQGAVVRPLEDAAGFLRSLFRQLHPRASQMQEVCCARLPGEIQALDRSAAYANQLLAQVGLGNQSFRHDAAGAVVDYLEAGVWYREVLVTGIVDMPAAMTWKNTRTLAFRAPRAEFDRWRPVMDVMRFSVRFTPQWVLSEAKGQRERADVVLRVFDEVRRIDRDMLRRTRINREEIMNDNFLVLTAQEEYVNPHSGEMEVDTDAYRYRWTTSGGDVFYTDREDVDPNQWTQGADYRRTPVRKRRNQ